ncbi:hypothetical protein [Novosphingobium sp.]|uniref:hypothetical protein n=1 Tax=Novosphingobium sp. TaxID=1874826 RepID=UPI0035B2C0FF
MDEIRIFYSWQSDRDDDVCRRFGRIALNEAIGAIQSRFPFDLMLDSDTAGVAGTPPVSETILRKIRRCAVFVGDVSFVAETSGGKLVPNPNVLTEYGYARALLDDEQIILVMNTAFGEPTALPFDLAHLRHPASWRLAEGASDGERRKVRGVFAKKMEDYLAASIDHALAKRAAGAVQPDAMRAAHEMIADLRNRTGRGDVPAIVPGPRLVMRMAPAKPVAYLDPVAIKKLKLHFVPEAYERAEAITSLGQWASYDPVKQRSDGLNPEARWYTRLVEPGCLEASLTVGARIQDDPDIVVDGRRLEGTIVETARRLAALLKELGASGPVSLEASVHDLQDVKIRGARTTSRMLRIPGLELGMVDLPSSDAVQPGALRRMLDALWLASGFEDGSTGFSGETWTGDESGALYEPIYIGGGAA